MALERAKGQRILLKLSIYFTVKASPSQAIHAIEGISMQHLHDQKHLLIPPRAFSKPRRIQNPLALYHFSGKSSYSVVEENGRRASACRRNFRTTIVMMKIAVINPCLDVLAKLF
jgi:hypothetical protein